MNATAAWPVGGVDVAKSVFQLAVADGAWRMVESHRLTRTPFERWFVNRAVLRAVSVAVRAGKPQPDRVPGDVTCFDNVRQQGGYSSGSMCGNG